MPRSSSIRSGLRGDVRIHRQHDACLAPAARDGGGQVRGRHRAHCLQRHPLRPGCGWLALLLLEPAPAPIGGSRGPGGCCLDTARRVVPGVVLPAQPDALPGHVPGQVATVDDGGIQIFQFATGTLEARVGGEIVRLEVETGYPWADGCRDRHHPERRAPLGALRPGPRLVPGRHGDAERIDGPGRVGTGHGHAGSHLAGADRIALHLRMEPRSSPGPADRLAPADGRAGTRSACLCCRGRRPARRRLGRVDRGRSGARGAGRVRTDTRPGRSDPFGLRCPGPRRWAGHRLAIREPARGGSGDTPRAAEPPGSRSTPCPTSRGPSDPALACGSGCRCGQSPASDE